MTSIFCADIYGKAFIARRTFTPSVESVKNTQPSIPDDVKATFGMGFQ
jgi:hypothetical protein